MQAAKFSTEQFLLEKYKSPTITTAQLAGELHVTQKSLQNMISAGRCPIPTYKMGKIRVANVVDIAQFIDTRGKVAA